MNAKIGIFVMLLLVSGIFATSIVLADDAVLTNEETVSIEVDSSEGGGSSEEVGEVVEASEVSVGEINAEEVSVVLEEVEISEDPKLKRVGFVNTRRGHGWIENGEKGHLITGLWVVQKFATVESTAVAAEVNSVLRTFGRLHISGKGMYKLVRYRDETSENSVNFYVVPLKKKVTMDNAKDYAVGKLSLIKKNSYKGLKTWEGSLVFDSGDLSGEWNVDLGTTAKKVRPGAVIAKAIATDGKAGKKIRAVRDSALEDAGVETIAELNDKQKAELRGEVKQIAKKSFWRMIQFWRRD